MKDQRDAQKHSDSWQPPQMEYGLHLGKIIHDKIDRIPGLMFKEVAERVGMTASGFYSKLKSPVYGNIYDLIRVSIAVGHDFVSYAEAPVRSEGVEIEAVYSEEEYNRIESDLDKCRSELSRYKKNNDALHAHIEELKDKLDNLKS